MGNPRRKILHLDLDAFFCAVEELRDPTLKGKAFAVGGRPDARGVVSSCSYAARQYGVHSAMPMAQALRICPKLIVVSTRHSNYEQKSTEVMRILCDLSPLVEQVSIDEAFVDFSDLSEPGVDIAKALQMRILKETGLPCSIGVASNKLVAKIANDTGKARHKLPTSPMAITVVPSGSEAEFLAPLKVGALWGVGPRTAEQLHLLGLQTIGDLARMDEARLVEVFGKNGRDLYRHARGLDDSPVSPESEVKSISQEITFDRDVAQREKLLDTLRGLSEQVAFRLRAERVCARTIRIKLRWPDFSTHTRQITLSTATDQDGVIFALVESLFMELWEPGKAVRLLGVGAGGLEESMHQLSLWDNMDEKERRLLDAMDDLRNRFGRKAVVRGFHLKSEKSKSGTSV